MPVSHINVEHCIPLEPAYPLIIAHIAGPEVDESERELRDRLTAIVRSTRPLMRVLSVARHLSLPDWLVFSGAVYQPVLNI